MAASDVKKSVAIMLMILLVVTQAHEDIIKSQEIKTNNPLLILDNDCFTECLREKKKND
uniref:Nodule-specific protein n=1 Tax=Astragalus sinicus TaxID=47065 RepID=Q07A29_ASTSI|nr:nodule-specific protein [Astragalus sinicus]